MSDEYELVLGIEVHMQLATEQKMFCSCKNDPFYSEPNTNVCPVCLGLPGAMPVPNLNAIKSAQKMANALGGNLNNQIIFERKNYFYPDLPKAFQLTCPHYPISTGGSVDLTYFGIDYPIRWREIHLEEDTAKSMHTDKTYIDFNKSSVPLLEMVTEPDFHDIEHAVIFCKEIQLIARRLGVSDADMEKGQMRLEANISVRKIGQIDLPNYRVELKNINSFGFMKKALEYELRRQIQELSLGNKLSQETRGFNESKNETFVQRSKEEANDYRYFPEPDIPPIIFSDEDLQEITTFQIELPAVTRSKLKSLNISINYIDILVNDFEKLQKVYDLIQQFKYEPKKAVILVCEYPQNFSLTAKQIDDYQKQKMLGFIDSDQEITKLVDEVILQNDKVVSDYKSGKESALQFLIGQVMRLAKGKADATKVKEILLKNIK